MTTSPDDASADAGAHGPPFRIQIDRVSYEAPKTPMTGRELRNLPSPPIGPDRDLFEVIPGQPDHKVEIDEEVRIRNGLRFFTAPARINPGCSG